MLALREGDFCELDSNLLFNVAGDHGGIFFTLSSLSAIESIGNSSQAAVA